MKLRTTSTHVTLTREEIKQIGDPPHSDILYQRSENEECIVWYGYSNNWRCSKQTKVWTSPNKGDEIVEEPLLEKWFKSLVV